MFFVDKLSFESGVVSAWKPDSGVALHALEANQDILHDVHGMASMQRCVGVWWRHEDGEGWFVIGFSG